MVHEFSQLCLAFGWSWAPEYIENNTWVRGNARFISSVEHDIMFNTRNKSGITKHPCIFLFII